MLELRQHQDRAVNLLRQAWKKERTHLIDLPTGGGKTELAVYICKGMIERKMRIMFVAPYTVLIDQTAERFRKYGLDDISIIWQDHPDHRPLAPIQIASADTLIRREFPDNIDCLIIDEAHLRRKDLLKVIEEADFPVIGLSATPYAPWMGNYYSSFIKPTSMRHLIDNGYLVDFEFYAPCRPSMKGVPTTNTHFGPDYKEQAVAEIMGDAKLVGNVVENWLENGRNLPTICYCVNILHANEITNRFNSAGVPCEIITAKTKQYERTDILGRYRLGITKVICNVGTMVAGLDEDVRCIIYARPTKSEMRWKQCLGRGARTAKGKEYCLVFDHSGTVHRLGFPDEIEYDSLQIKSDGMEEAEQIKQQIEKLEKLPKECPKCKRMKPAGERECVKCGFTPRAGEDVDTDETRQIEKLRDRLQKETGPDPQVFYSELIGYAKERTANGKRTSDGWAAHKFKAKFGDWPNGLQKFPRPPSIQTRNWIKSQNIRYAKRKQKGAA